MQPNGQSIRIYNTLSREKEPFTTIAPGRVGVYLCGPTVYKPPHIGHLVGPVIFDAIQRYLTFAGYKVTFVINITDVDDKLIEKAKETGQSVVELARHFELEYRTVLGDLGIDTIDHFPRVSENITEIISLCKLLLDKGFAYAVDGNLWMDVSKVAHYGQLSRRKLDQMETVRESVGSGGKKSPADFALWKAAKPGEPLWETPWGNGIGGRPGWHIECSAMSMKLLGETFDIHGGGLDLLFPHHENELAQSQCATGKPLSKYWMHNGLTRIKTKLSSGEWASEKMSGSIGNVIGARELLDTYGPEVLRYFLLSTHYRSPIEFTDQALSDAVKGYHSFTRLFQRVGLTDLRHSVVGTGPTPDVAALSDQFWQEAAAAMADDFNTSGVIATLHKWASAANGLAGAAEVASDASGTAAARWLAAAMVDCGRKLIGLFRTSAEPGVAGKADDSLTAALGTLLASVAPAGSGTPPTTTAGLMDALIARRSEARKTKNFAAADDIRKGLDALGIVLEDKPQGTGWSRKS